MRSLRVITSIVLSLLAATALPGGWMLMSDPTGALLGMDTGLLQHTRFVNFAIPGLVLFVANGVFSLVTLVTVLKKVRHAGLLVTVQGVILGGWIAIQVLLIRELNWLHVAMALLSSTLILLGLLEEVGERSQDDYKGSNIDKHHRWA